MKKPKNDLMEAVVRSLAESIDTPRSLAVWLCFKHNHEALLELPLPAIADNDPQKFQLDYFITEYLSKYKGLKVSWDTREVALGKWKVAEQQCYETNRRFRAAQLRPFTGRAEAVLFRAQRKIAALLGSLRIPVALSDCKWGPGATFDLNRTRSTPDKKMTQPVSVTIQALPYLRAVLESDPHWAGALLGEIPEGAFSLLPDCFKLVRGSRFLTVPKSAKTDRCIAAEPTGNSFLQQGVHAYIRRRLKRFGIDLDDQSINQNGARCAYTDRLSTLDLSSASDTISRELVYYLLPLDWAMFLDSLRSPETLVDGSWVRTEKFASMGNAFCFELETLIFWAICSSVEDECVTGVNRVTVYGDDLVVSRVSYDSAVEMLQLCGFTVNEKKSFKEGNFFESCGKHFHMGQEVTPVYQKEVLNHPSEIIRAHNRLVRFQATILGTFVRKNIVRRACRELREIYPLRPFPRIPYGVQEDGGFLRPVAEFSADPNRGFRCHVLDYVPQYTGARDDALLAYKLRRRSYSNPLNTGHCANVTKGRYRTKVRYIPESALSRVKPVDVHVILGIETSGPGGWVASTDISTS